MDPAGPPEVTLPVVWNEQGVTLKDMNSKHSLPTLAKVIKGQYRNIGISKTVHSEVFVHSVRTTRKVLAESIRVKESKQKVVVSDQKYAVPVTYQGWFELLSADGKAIKAMQSVQELSRAAPSSCLVRENMKGYIERDTGELKLDRMRVVHAGELLTLDGDAWVPYPMGKAGVGKRKLLRCQDSKGERVYLGFEQKGLFSAVAGQNNISGVHSLKTLLEKFRLPIMVRLVHGIIPSKIEKGFTGVFRIVNVYSDETAFVCPLAVNAKMVPISTREPIKLTVAQNFEELQDTENIRYYQKKCNQMLASYLNSIHVLIAMPDPDALARGRDDLVKSQDKLMSQWTNSSGTVRANGTLHMSNSPAILAQLEKAKGTISRQSSIPVGEEDVLFEEVDDIYRYVREGGEVPEPRQRPLVAKTQVVTHGAETVMEQTVELFDEDDGRENSDENYWEEPIYEPLEKIREMKKKVEQGGGFGASSGSGDSGERGGGAGEGHDGMPTATFRQGYRGGHARLKSSNSNDSNNEKAYDTMPPPVPPKLYDEADVSDAVPDSRGTPQPGTMAVSFGPKGVVHHQPQQPQHSHHNHTHQPVQHHHHHDHHHPQQQHPQHHHLQHQHSGASSSSTYGESVYQSSPPQPEHYHHQHSGQHPPYVAVARVGPDSYGSQDFAMSSTNIHDLSDTYIDNTRAGMQSMYL